MPNMATFEMRYLLQSIIACHQETSDPGTVDDVTIFEPSKRPIFMLGP